MKYVSNPKLVENAWHWEVKCKNCGKTFHAKRRTAIYCSPTCRMMYFYKGTTPKEQTKETIKAPPVGKFQEVFKKYDLIKFLRSKGVRGVSWDVPVCSINSTIVLQGNTKDVLNGISVKRISNTHYSVTI